ncbi:MAG: hypothetical protein OXF11_12300 [Deltaproteobacteria bacterium]|nr:hypothetical protein [Deltaproteobacteria bacterium]
MSFRGYSTVFTGALFLMLAWGLWEASKWEIQASLMAWMIGLPTAGLLALQLARQLAGSDEKAAPTDAGEPGMLDASLLEQEGDDLDPAEERRRTASIIGWILCFALAIWLLGFQFGVGLMTFLYLKSAGESWLTVVSITTAVLGAVMLAFDCGMHIFFAEGKLFVWTGLTTSPLFTSVCYQVSVLVGAR